MPTLSAIIIAKDEEEMIEVALKTLKFADEIIVADTGSTDNTLKIAKKYATKVAKITGKSFGSWRDQAAKIAKGDWILYLDADERIPPKLAKEISATILEPVHDAYTISRYEILLGKHLKHWPDTYVLRLIKKSSLKKWQGKLHEQPIIKGTVGKLREQMVHLSHRNFTDKILKTASWSKTEGKLLLAANHPPMRSWRFFRIILTEFFGRYFKQGLWRDGTEGTLEAIYQSFSRFISYARLWELQRQPSLKKTYQHIDKQILSDWETNS